MDFAKQEYLPRNRWGNGRSKDGWSQKVCMTAMSRRLGINRRTPQDSRADRYPRTLAINGR
jgi:hypothetical protein